MSKPLLHVFSISHYCEKARWALDHLNVDYQLNRLAPGTHIKKAKLLGLKRGSLPYLELPGQVIQGSAQIVDWAESVSRHDNALTNADNRDTCRELERRLDDVIGVHVRRYFYSEAIVAHPATVLPIFRHGLGFFEQLKLRLAWKVICRLMTKGMDLGPGQREESRDLLEQELDWLDSLLADGRPFLTGDSLTRADIAAASLLAPVALPPEHPEYERVVVPPLAKAEIAGWRDRPSINHTLAVYKNVRGRPLSAAASSG